MRKTIVEKKYDKKKIVPFLLSSFNGLSENLIYKTIRKKDIVVNNVRIKENVVLHENDQITIYLTDDILFKPLNIIYEDENILIVDKPIQLEVVGKEGISLTSLLEEKYDYIKPCHRLDRNTSGLVLFAKNENSLDILLEKFKNNEISKYYKCLVYGVPPKRQDTLTAYMFKDEKKSLVYISDTPKKAYKEIITSYKILETNKNTHTSLLEIELHTGRTHQIRAHLAHIGCPIIGDGKYGINEINKKLGKTTQELYAYKIVFNFNSDNTILNYLTHKEIILK